MVKFHKVNDLMKQESLKEDTNWDIFYDEKMNADFSQKGFQILTVDDINILEELSEVYDEVSHKYDDGFTTTFLIPDHSHRKLMHEKVSKILENTIQLYFKSYRQICAGFAVKKSGDQKSEMPLHQDISMLEPNGRPGLSFWLPLMPTNKNNGNLEVIPKSHLFHSHARAAGTPFPLINKEAELREHYLLPIPTKYGQVIVINQALFHASPSNLSNANRVVATSVLLPQEVSAFYYFRIKNVQPAILESYKVPDDFYFDLHLGTRPNSIKLNTSFEEHTSSADLSLFPKIERSIIDC